MSSSNPFNFPRAHVRAQSDKIIQAQTLHESKTVASCVDTTNKLMKVDIVASSGAGGLATAANQTTVINATLRDINNTGAIGDGSSQASAMCLGYDRSNGQGRSLLVDANGTLETNVNMNAGHGLATEAKQDDIINATNRAINNTGSIGDGSTNATAIALGYDRTNGKGRAVLVDDGGRLDVNCLGNTVGDGSGDVKSLHLDGDGNVQTNVVNTVNIEPANSVNSGITNDPANSVACGMRGRTNITDSSTETFILTDAQGHLQCDVLSSVGGDTRIKGNDGNDGSGTDRVIKTDANGALIVDASKEGLVSANGTTTALHTMMLATNDGTNLRTVACDGNGVLTVDNSGVTQPVSGTVTANAGTGTFAVSAASLPLPSGAATEATLSNAEGHLGTIDTSTAGILASHYQEGDAIGASDTGVLIMGRNGTNTAKPIHITNNGDVEVEIADFVKGQATKANSFPVVLASDQDTLAVEQSYSYGSEYTIINAQTIADSASFTSAAFEIQSVKNIQAIISLSVSAGGSTNYEIDFQGSLNGSDFFSFPDSTIFGTTDVIVSTEKSGIVPVRYMKVKITNKNGSGSHTFTVKGSVLGATLASP